MNNSLHDQLRHMFAEHFHVEVTDDSIDLIESGFLDSQAFVDLLLHLEQEYGVRMNTDELELDYFRTVNSIAALVTAMNPAVVASLGNGKDVSREASAVAQSPNDKAS